MSRTRDVWLRGQPPPTTTIVVEPPPVHVLTPGRTMDVDAALPARRDLSEWLREPPPYGGGFVS